MKMRLRTFMVRSLIFLGAPWGKPLWSMNWFRSSREFVAPVVAIDEFLAGVITWIEPTPKRHWRSSQAFVKF